jgi:hypothetical protein
MGVIKINYSGLRPIYNGGITTTRQLMRELKDMENFITVIIGDREYIIDHIASVKTHANMDDSCIHKALICNEMSGKNIIR